MAQFKSIPSVSCNFDRLYRTNLSGLRNNFLGRIKANPHLKGFFLDSYRIMVQTAI